MGKVILVTGASRGIGRSIVDQIIKFGDDVVVYGVARSESPLKEIKQQYGNKFFYVSGDITNEAVIKEVVDTAVKNHGRLDALVANAGVLDPVQNVNSIDVAGWKRLFDINFFSIVSLVSYALPHLKKSNGDIVFVSSDASDTYFNSWGAYGSSKAALNHFAMTIAGDEKSVKAIAVAPGIVDTNMQENIRENFGPKSMSKEALDFFNGLHKTGKLVTSDVPATVYGKLALFGIPEEYNGKYLHYDDPELKKFSL